MVRHVAVRCESACAHLGRQPRPFRGSPRPLPGLACSSGGGGDLRGLACACVGQGQGRAWPGRRVRTRKTRKGVVCGPFSKIHGSGCGAQRTPRGEDGKPRGLCSEALAVSFVQPLFAFAGLGHGGLPPCRWWDRPTVSPPLAPPSCIPRVFSGSQSCAVAGSLRSGGSRVGAPCLPDGVAAACAVASSSGGRASGDRV